MATVIILPHEGQHDNRAMAQVTTNTFRSILTKDPISHHLRKANGDQPTTLLRQKNYFKKLVISPFYIPVV
jgi:hypothetical protein